MRKGTVTNRETFLDHVAGELGRDRKIGGVARPNWQKQVQWNVLADCTEDELVDVLKAQCQSIHTQFHRTSRENLADVLKEVVDLFGGKTVITSEDARFSDYGLCEVFDSWDGITTAVWDAERAEESIHRAEQADVGITFSDITLAESGTVVLFADEGKGRSVSLLPSTYIAVIPKSTIVPRLSQATREIHRRVEQGEGVPTCINFISGPSNSADIEMNLVVGVHGPIKAAYIVVD